MIVLRIVVDLPDEEHLDNVGAKVFDQRVRIIGEQLERHDLAQCHVEHVTRRILKFALGFLKISIRIFV